METVVLKVNKQVGERIMKMISNKHERMKKRQEYFKTLEKNVDYVEVLVDADCPYKVFRRKPISDKGRKFFKGEF